MEKVYQRRYDIDFLRIISSLMVVLLHTTAMGPLVWGEKGFVINTLLNCISRFSVPVFIMISGYFMLHGDESPSFYIKRCAKLILTMLMWSALYLIKYILTDAISIKGVKEAVIYLLTEPVHLWYFYALAALTLFTPMLSIFAKNASKQTYLYTLWVMFVLGCIVTVLIRENVSPTLVLIADKMKTGTLTAFPGYYLFGYYVRRFGVNKKAALLCGAAGLFITVAAVFSLSFKMGALNESLLSFFAPNTALMSAGIFAFFEGRKIKLQRVIKAIAPVTAGIYGVHMIVLPSVYERLQFITADFLKIISAVTITYVISAIVTAAYKKVKKFTSLIHRSDV